ncbi:hypothetical protein [Brevibacterium celere]
MTVTKYTPTRDPNSADMRTNRDIPMSAMDVTGATKAFAAGRIAIH